MTQPNPVALARNVFFNESYRRSLSDQDDQKPANVDAEQHSTRQPEPFKGTQSRLLYRSIDEYLAASDSLLVRDQEVELDDPAMLQEHADAGGTYQDINGEVFVDGVSYTDIDQGQVGDCYFLAALSGIALTNPEYIEQMITDNGDGTYTVHFGGSMGDVTVDDDFAVDGNGNKLYSGTGDGATPELWVAIIEKAYAQEHGGYGPIEGGRTEQAIQEITGQSGFEIVSTSDVTPEQIETALGEGRIVTASSNTTANGNGIVSNHAYVVLEVRDGPNGPEVRVYNPWGQTEVGTDDANDGSFWMSMDDFNASFRTVEIMDNPVPPTSEQNRIKMADRIING
jgi:hypothetical protein